MKYEDMTIGLRVRTARESLYDADGLNLPLDAGVTGTVAEIKGVRQPPMRRGAKPNPGVLIVLDQPIPCDDDPTVGEPYERLFIYERNQPGSTSADDFEPIA